MAPVKGEQGMSVWRALVESGFGGYFVGLVESWRRVVVCVFGSILLLCEIIISFMICIPMILMV